jgi:hypothetical protein
MSEMTAEKAKNILATNKWHGQEKTTVEHNEALEIALTALDQLRWRDVEKEPPVDGQQVIVLWRGKYHIATYSNDGKGGNVQIKFFSHIMGTNSSTQCWLPLPQAPEVKK